MGGAAAGVEGRVASGHAVTRFWWVRHGPTHAKVFTGWRDVAADLSDKKQVGRLDDFLPGGSVLISSDLMRAVATADALEAGRDRLPHDADLREFHFGEWEGRHFSDVSVTDPDLSRAYWENPGEVAAPGGESWNSAAARVNKAAGRLLAAHPGRDIVVVAHLGVILTQLQAARGDTAYQTLAQAIEPWSVTRIDFGSGRWSVGLINHIP
jgi:broad specificity phosphatase PhoE